MGRTSTKDQHSKGRPFTSLTEDSMKKVDEVGDRSKSDYKYVLRSQKISYGSFQIILTNELSLRRWVPRMLTDEQKKKRIDISRVKSQKVVISFIKIIKHLVNFLH